MAVWQFLLLFVFLALSYLSLLSDAKTGSTPRSNNDNDFTSKLQEIKRKIAYLESVHEESIQKLNEKMHYIEEQKKQIQQMSHKIHLLQSAVLNLKAHSSHVDQRLNALEEEVQHLWAASRKNNFDIHLLESRAQDAEDTLETVTSQVEKMGDIVTEQWMHIQRLEQAVHITEVRALRARRQGYLRCSFLKLQRFIKQEMEKNKFTAALANNELVFFVASALITFPIISGWMLLSSQCR
ncbi:hypothetical protein FNV43_RR07528 [Rhamnella rubrinervis]|uniref:Uncharacterized protein n=1 Tax=Rhamnella rubrinervis TaxID=2594499 RepID=A0A8K0MMT8_9ROSA|nr:hypothetical protein FNV43_RR07528 [Rhamnella rubrinervis]